MKLRIFGLVAIAAFAVTCLLGSAQTHAQNAYIANSGSDNVSVINTATNAVIATIPIGYSPYGVATVPDGSKVYVTTNGGVSVIDAATNTLTATIPFTQPVLAAVATPDSRKVYIGGFITPVSVIDTATNVVTDIDLVTAVQGMAVTPDGSRVYVATEGTYVAVIDTASDTATDVITVTPDGAGMKGIAVAGAQVYVALVTDEVAVIDTATDTVTTTITDPRLYNAFGIAASPDGRRVYVTNSSTPGAVVVIDTATNTVMGSVTVGDQPTGVSVTPDGRKVYTSNVVSNNVTAINADTNTLITTIPVGLNPWSMGTFIGPAPQFAGTPGAPNCRGESVSALAQKYGGLAAAAAALGYSSVQALQNDIAEYCAG